MTDSARGSTKESTLQTAKLRSQSKGQWLWVSGQIAVAAAAIIGLLTVPPAYDWVALYVGVAGLISLIMAGAALGPSPIQQGLHRLVRLVSIGALRIRLAGLTLLGLWVAGVGLFIWQLTLQDINHAPVYAIFVLVWPWLTLGVWFTILSAEYQAARRFVARLVAVLISFVFFGLLLEGLMQVAFDRLPTAITVRSPLSVTRLYQVYADPNSGVTGYLPNQSVTVQAGGSTGDMFFKSCLNPRQAQDEPYTFTYMRDEHGFRNPSPWPDQVDVVVTGDSFVYAQAIPMPFWQDLDISTLALGMDATGTLEQRRIVKAYGLTRAPKVMVLAFYEGNDLNNNFSYFVDQGRGIGYADWIDGQPLRNFFLIYHTAGWLKDSLGVQPCDWPIEDSQGRKLAFFEEEMPLSTLSYATLKTSEFYAVTRDAILGLASDVHAVGATFVLAFIPTKLHAYWNTVPGQVETIVAHVEPWEVFEKGLPSAIENPSPQQTSALLRAGIDAQRDLLAELAVENDFLFLDFTAPFQAAIDAGANPYFFGDSHWNQEGHDLARAVLKEFLVTLLPE